MGAEACASRVALLRVVRWGEGDDTLAFLLGGESSAMRAVMDGGKQGEDTCEVGRVVRDHIGHRRPRPVSTSGSVDSVRWTHVSCPGVAGPLSSRDMPPPSPLAAKGAAVPEHCFYCFEVIHATLTGESERVTVFDTAAE